MSIMEKAQAGMEKTLIPLATKLSGNKVLKGISGGFSALLPVIMVGAFASLLGGLNITAYQNLITSIGLKPILSYIPSYTTNMIALYAVFSIGRATANQLECKDQSIGVGLIALMSFLLSIPTGITAGETVVASAIDTTYFGSAGIFTAMVVGVVVAYIYNIFVKRNITIKLPESVPPIVANGFSGIIPAVAITALMIVVRQLCTLTSFGTLNGLVYGILRAPLAALASSPFTFVLFMTLCNLLWFFGIHGGMVVMPFLSMLYMAPALENLEALAAGAAMPNLLTNTWWFTFCQIGGCGGAIGLGICMILFAKSKRYKSLGKLAIVPVICGISEPIIFGMPMMLNPLMFIPMILAPIANFTMSYVFTSIGILPYLNGLQMSTGTPVIMSGLLAGGVVAAIWQVVLVAMDTAIYFAFFKMCDKQAVEAEENEAE